MVGYSEQFKIEFMEKNTMFSFVFFQLQLEKSSQGDSGEFDAPSSNGDDSDEDDKSPTEDEEAQDSPGPAVTPKEFDSDVGSNLFT